MDQDRKDAPLKESEIEIRIDERGISFEAGSEAAGLAFIMLLLTGAAKGVIEYGKETALAKVTENNQLRHPLLMPMINCPEMVYPDACAVCFWHDAKLDNCHGG